MNKKILRTVFVVLVLSLIILFSSMLFLPDDLFDDTYSTVILDRNDILLGAKIADDEQWRFASKGNIPDKFKESLLTYEDSYFYYHPGINIISIISAAVDNFKSGKIVRGGSTISMQVIRLSRKGKERTYLQKFIEGYLTIGLELIYSKDSILSMYCSNAPMGGNIVGLEAASWRYFGHSQHELSWAEAATLAVLPNSPSMIHPGKNRSILLEKRNGLLLKLLEQGKIDSVEYSLSLLEKIPDRPKTVPQIAYHLLQYFINSGHKGEVIKTTIDYNIQKNAVRIVDSYYNDLHNNAINNVAAIIVSPKNKEVRAYIGNFSNILGDRVEFRYNDMVRSNRSTGSILKPFLYAALINDGSILPNSLIRDIPSYFDNYHPENYDGEFRGVVPASMALSQSLNVPAVYMLQEYGISRFQSLLRELGFSSFNRSADNYGLSLILGGGETSLFELANAYSGMAKTVWYYDSYYGNYPKHPYNNLVLSYTDPQVSKEIESPPLSAASIWLTYNALKKVSRPQSEEGWEEFASSSKIAWKTGTSHGFKDAWSIGSTSDYVVGVWVGNADGKGRMGLSGTKSAAPVMFELFNSLVVETDFYPPYDELTPMIVCRHSGNIASRFCKETETIYSYNSSKTQNICKYHKLIFLDSTDKYRVNQSCYPVSDMNISSWFVLPPVQEYYFSLKNPEYKRLAPFLKDCEESNDIVGIDIVYPINGTTIFIARNEGGTKNKIVFEVKHNTPEQKIYWHIDNSLIGITKSNDHKISIIPEQGDHNLTVVDENGNSRSVTFHVIDPD